MTLAFAAEPSGTQSPTVRESHGVATEQVVGNRRSYYSQLAEFSGPKRPGCFDFLRAPSLINGRRVFRA